MKKIFLALIILIIVGICIPAVSAGTIIDEDLYYSGDTSVSSGAVTATPVGSIRQFDRLHLTNVELRQNLYYVGTTIESDVKPGGMREGRNVVSYTFNGYTDTAIVYYTLHRNLLGTVTHTQILVFFDNWDADGLTGTHKIQFNTPIFNNLQGYPGEDAPNAYWRGGTFGDIKNSRVVGTVVTSTTEFKNHLLVEADDTFYNIKLTRNIDGKAYLSRCEFLKDETTVNYNEGTTDLDVLYLKSDISDIRVISGDKVYAYPLGTIDTPDDPDEDPTVTVYIKNSQTGAIIANSNIVIDAFVNGEYYTVANRTEPSGIFSITLQPTGGGQPNPDGYRLIATADGYNNPMPEINFTVDDYKKYIYCLLDPIAGGPENENNTFIDFFVRDMSANPISGATVNFGGYTLITNSAGYTVFEVGKNSTYTYTVSKSGYGSLTGNVVIGADPRHTINTVLAPAITPTTPTPIPTSTSIKPTLTMTAPSGEPVSNWLEWFAAHFGMILGGGVEIGKIFMWLCFTVPVGVYVGKESKAGAAGFMAGAGIVTLFFVLIGWVPIWLLVLLALIIGLLYAKVFNNSDTGGGR